MTTIEAMKDFIDHSASWHPCPPRDVLTVTQAHDLWLPLCDDDRQFMLVDWLENPTMFLPSGFRKFQFLHEENPDFTSFAVEIITEPRNYQTRLEANQVVIWWFRSDWD